MLLKWQLFSVFDIKIDDISRFLNGQIAGVDAQVILVHITPGFVGIIAVVSGTALIRLFD